MSTASKEFNYVAFVKLFSILWLSFIALTPYLVLIFALSVIDFDFSSRLFRFLINFMSVPILPLVIILLFKKDVPQVNRIKSFIGLNARRFFLIGIVSFYLALLVSLIFSIGNIFEVIISFLFSLVAFPVLSFMLRFGLKFSAEIEKKLNETV